MIGDLAVVPQIISGVRRIEAAVKIIREILSHVPRFIGYTAG